MADLIDRYATMNAIPAPTDADEAEYYGKVCDAIETMPTIEPEVRHGRWVEVSNRVTYPIESDVVVKCNTCVHHEVTSRFKLDILRYCTYCGAKMDLRTPTEVQLEEADSVMMGGAENDQI